jgi:hypothetical protein
MTIRYILEEDLGTLMFVDKAIPITGLERP